MSSRPASGPFWFGTATRPCFGWLHLPPEREPSVDAEVRPLAVVICNPFGHEALAAHRSLRHLAQALALAGIPALRFDYDGTGDSAGNDLDPERLRGWIDSIHTAIAALRADTGAARIALIGVRLGALLASVAAGEREDIAGVALLAPWVRGRDAVREIGALQSAHLEGLSQADQTRIAQSAPADGSTEALGFVMRQDTRDALNAIDLMRLQRAPAPEMLVLDREDLPRAARWVEHLRSIGATVDAREVEGHVKMMLDPHLAEVPSMQIAIVREWLATIAGRTSVVAPAAASDPDASKPTDSTVTRTERCWIEPSAPSIPIRERAIFIDAATRLFGIASDLPRAAPVDKETPANAASTSSRKAILLLNAGAIHRVGPNRAWVGLAREWAARGHLVLRVDLAGLGDSPARDGKDENLSYAHTATADVAAAIRWLHKEASRAAAARTAAPHAATAQAPILAIGLCSGAYLALKAAADQPLASVVMINPLAFHLDPWNEGQPEYELGLLAHKVLDESARYASRLRDPDAWKKLLRGGVNLRTLTTIIAKRVAAAIDGPLRDIGRALRIPISNDLGGELLHAERRGVDLVFVFSAGDPGRALLRLQGGRSVAKLEARGALREILIDPAGHTFTLRAPRERLLEHLRGIVDAPAQ